MDLSIVIPFYNEEESVVPLCEATRAALDSTTRRFEVLLVDDGSTDRTFEHMLKIAERDRRFRILKLRGNYGQTAALALLIAGCAQQEGDTPEQAWIVALGNRDAQELADFYSQNATLQFRNQQMNGLAQIGGFNHAEGDVIVSMDGDLQNDPRDIPAMVERLMEGHDVVTGWRENRKDALFVRKVPSMVANWLVRKVTGVSIRDNGCGLRAYRAEVIKKYCLYSDMHRLLPTIVGLTGADIAEMRVRHHPREYGESKYGLSRIYKFLFDLAALKIIITLFWLPLFGFGLLALFFIMLSVGTLFGGLIHLSVDPTTTMVIYVGASTLLFSLGAFLLILGILCTWIYDMGGNRVESVLKLEMH